MYPEYNLSSGPEGVHSNNNSISVAVTDKQTVGTVTAESRPPANPTYAHFSLSRSPPVPFDFAPPCPLMVEPIESFRIRLLGGRTLDRRK